jgi:glycosyltransferase involved in cell wall biosynthesis
MNITMVTRAHWPAIGGAETYQHIVANELSKKHTVKILTQVNTDKRLTIKELTYGIKSFKPYKDGLAEVFSLCPSVEERKRMLPLKDYNSIEADEHFFPIYHSGYARILKELIKGSDIVHSFNGYFLGASAYKIAKELKIPFVITPQCHPGWWLDEAFNINLYRKSKAVFTALNYERDFLIEVGIDPEKIHVIGNVFEVSSTYTNFKKDYNINGDIVLFLGAKRPYKGYLEILKSTKEVWKKYPNTWFVFIGSKKSIGTFGADKTFKQFEDSRIIELSDLSLEEKTSAVKESTMLCLPSLSESFGIAVLEAWYYKKPVIVGDIPTSKELVGKDGLIVKQEVEPITEAIKKLLGNKTLRNELGEAGYKKVQRKYLPRKVVSKIETVYKEVLNGIH